jgi:erythronate-4-phosphate dehydrogenase
MNIVADRAIPFLQEYFADLGSLEAVDGRDIDRDRVRNAELLLVRTVTGVGRRLLEGSSVRFVASPGAGVDHVDLAWLRTAGIGFAHAPGSNARAVAEYVLSVLFSLAAPRGRDPATLCVGIVGCGEVGSRLGEFLDVLGIEHLDCDPPLHDAGRTGWWRELDELRKADVISLHVPLTEAGPYATRNLVDRELLRRLRGDVLLINTSRGGVVDEEALLEFLERHPQAACALDVWEGEPAIRVDLLRRSAIGTPHIAGYSLDARLRATTAVSRAVRSYFGIRTDPAEPALPVPEPAEVRVGPGQSECEALATAVLGSYDVRLDAARLRVLPELDAAERPAFFADLRNNYPVRREFPARTLHLPSGAAHLRARLDGLGFRTTMQD